MRNTTNTTVLNVTTGTTSGVIDVSLRKPKSLQCVNTGSTHGTATFSVKVSNDGTNFVTYNRLVSNVTKTNSQTDTHVASLVLSSLTTAGILFFPDGDYFRQMKVIVAKSAQTSTVDGTYTAVLQTID